MLWWILNEWEERDNYEIIVVFANTGVEAPETYDFVKQCADNFGVEIIWVDVEPVKRADRIIKQGKNKGKIKKGAWWGVKHNVVNYETASRHWNKNPDGSFIKTPFEKFIEKLGIPSTNAPWCSDQMKRKTILSYLKSIGWKKFYTILGMRYDEPKRIKKKKRILYLANYSVMGKWDIRYWWATKMNFDLQVPDGCGNCTCCWKKQDKTLISIAKKHPDYFAWWKRMTETYGHLNPRNTHLKPPFNFYRKNRNPDYFLEMSLKSESEIYQMTLFDEISDCEESCEPF